jgi:hypothetical protein
MDRHVSLPFFVISAVFSSPYPSFQKSYRAFATSPTILVDAGVRVNSI